MALPCDNKYSSLPHISPGCPKLNVSYKMTYSIAMKYFIFAELIMTTNIFQSMLNITGYAKPKLYLIMQKLSMDD
jgi:hypothetical protein